LKYLAIQIFGWPHVNVAVLILQVQWG